LSILATSIVQTVFIPSQIGLGYCFSRSATEVPDGKQLPLPSSEKGGIVSKSEYKYTSDINF
jgi:hypothetical protein